MVVLEKQSYLNTSRHKTGIRAHESKCFRLKEAPDSIDIQDISVPTDPSHFLLPLDLLKSQWSAHKSHFPPKWINQCGLDYLMVLVAREAMTSKGFCELTGTF